LYPDKESKVLSSILEAQSDAIISRIHDINEKALLDSLRKPRQEPEYVKLLAKNLDLYFNRLTIPGCSITATSRSIHLRPIVTLESGERCELGDLLIVIKYILGQHLLRQKAIIYQVKLSQNWSFAIDATQLYLLSEWPTFSFGKSGNNPQSYSLNPSTKEFGSYMFCLRRPKQIPTHFQSRKFPYLPFCFQGVAADALEVARAQRKTIRTDLLRYRDDVVVNLFRLLAWRIGELVKDKPDIDKLISALYRYIGLTKDPPEEFNGYYDDKGSFTVLQTCVKIEK